MTDLAISIRNVSKRYTISHDGERSKGVKELLRAKRSREIVWAVREVSFDVEQGEVVGIIGKNGAGKSTLLKILSRITEPTVGEIDLYGRVGALLEVGTGFHPELTGRENVFLNGAILGMSRGEVSRRFDEIVEFSGVERFLDTPVKRYSSGMYVRLAFAVAAHLEPDILILDEVLAVGDAEFQKKCLGKMRDVSAGGRTVLLVSHNLTVVKAVCTKAALMVGGQLCHIGPTSEVLDKYRNTGGEGEISLAEAGRLGNGDAQFTSLNIDSSGGADSNDGLRRAGDLVLRAAIAAKCDIVNSFVLAVVYDAEGVRVIDASTEMLGRLISLRAGESADVTIRLRRLYLREGNYAVSLWIGRTMLDCYDHVDHAGTFEVAHDSARIRPNMYPAPYTCDFDVEVTPRMKDS